MKAEQQRNLFKKKYPTSEPHQTGEFNDTPQSLNSRTHKLTDSKYYVVPNIANWCFRCSAHRHETKCKRQNGDRVRQGEREREMEREILDVWTVFVLAKHRLIMRTIYAATIDQTLSVARLTDSWYSRRYCYWLDHADTTDWPQNLWELYNTTFIDRWK